jgi:hypothetical protein
MIVWCPLQRQRIKQKVLMRKHGTEGCVTAMTREEAIKMLEYLATDTTGALAGCDGDYAEFLVRVIDALDMAIAALREQEERSKGCSACDGGFGDNTMVFYAGGYKHCPMCGRRLEDT